MTLHVLLWRIVGGCVVAAIAAALDVWRARARDIQPAPSFVSGLRIWIRYSIVLSIGMVFATGFESLERVWDFRFKPFSYDLTAHAEYVRQAVLLGFLICFLATASLVVRLLDKLVPNDLSKRTPIAENGH